MVLLTHFIFQISCIIFNICVWCVSENISANAEQKIGFYFCKVHVERRVNLLHVTSLPEKLRGNGGSNVLQGRSHKLWMCYIKSSQTPINHFTSHTLRKSWEPKETWAHHLFKVHNAMASPELAPAGVYQREGESSLKEATFMYNDRKVQRKILSRKFVPVFSITLALLWKACFVPGEDESGTWKWHLWKLFVCFRIRVSTWRLVVLFRGENCACWAYVSS